MSEVDDHLAGLDPERRAALAHIRALVHETVPEATEGKSYGMPAFRYRDRPLLGFVAAKQHLSVFPFSPEAIEAVKDRLGDFSLAKGTIRFQPDRPIPDDVLVDLVRHRLAELD